MTQPLSHELEARIESILQEMTLDEQVSLLAGADFWPVGPVCRACVRGSQVSYGREGARGGGARVGGVSAAAVPVSSSLACAWSSALVEEVGAALCEGALA